MSVTQYIGARYVPLFADPLTWDITKAYEALTIVYYQGNSFTSRQAVPAGIDITNDSYWALTGNYNAQIEQYRAEVQAYDGRITANTASNTAQDAQLAGTSSSGLKTLIDANTASNTSQDAQLAGTATSGLKTLIDANTADVSALDTFKDEQVEPILTGFMGVSPINAKSYIDTGLSRQAVTVEQYGAVGDGITDCTQAIQAAIDANPNSCITFKGGVYIITSTIFLNGDINSVSLDLNGSTIMWGGPTDEWTESQSYTVMSDHEGVTSSPSVMLCVERRSLTGESGKTAIMNGVIDGALKASICCQNTAFLTTFHNLRIENFQYAGILNGTLDGYLWNAGQSTGVTRSTQATISDCYFVRQGDMSARNTSAMFFTFPDNQIDNCVTNRTMYAFTMRNGGNSVSNTHTTIQYETMPTAQNYGGAACRLWPFSATTPQINIFDNCYFNGGKRVIYTYRGANQSFQGAALRTIISNSHYTFYTSGTAFSSMMDAEWYGGMWYGIITTIQCVLLYGDYVNMHLFAPPINPSVVVARANEKSFAQFSQPHEHSTMHDGNNYASGEQIITNNSAAPIPAGTYKKVAEIVTTSPVGTYHFPGTVKFEYSAQNGGYFFAGEIMRSGSAYVAQLSESFGTQSTTHLYVRDAQKTYTYNGLTYYITEVYLHAPGSSNITDLRLLKLEPTSPYVDVYAFPDPTNFSSGSNQNLYTEAPSGLVQVV